MIVHYKNVHLLSLLCCEAKIILIIITSQFLQNSGEIQNSVEKSKFCCLAQNSVTCGKPWALLTSRVVNIAVLQLLH